MVGCSDKPTAMTSAATTVATTEVEWVSLTVVGSAAEMVVTMADYLVGPQAATTVATMEIAMDEVME